MLATRNDSFKGKTVCISGSGNVAQYACQKATELGAKVVTLSDSSGYIHDPEGISPEKLEYVMELKNIFRGRIKEYAEKYPSATYYPGERPWGVKCDIAMPCATQNELNGDEAHQKAEDKKLDLWINGQPKINTTFRSTKKPVSVEVNDKKIPVVYQKSQVKVKL